MTILDKQHLINPVKVEEVLLYERTDETDLLLPDILGFQAHSKEMLKTLEFYEDGTFTEEELLDWCDGNIFNRFELREAEGVVKDVIKRPCYCDTDDEGILGVVEREPGKIGYYYPNPYGTFNFMFYDKSSNNILILDHTLVLLEEDCVVAFYSQKDSVELQKDAIDLILHATTDSVSEQVVKRLTQGKNQVIHWYNVASEGVTSDVAIYHHENPQELLNLRPSEIIKKFKVITPEEASSLKAFELKDGVVKSLIESVVN